eukprot:gene24905-biopygen23936
MLNHLPYLGTMVINSISEKKRVSKNRPLGTPCRSRTRASSTSFSIALVVRGKQKGPRLCGAPQIAPKRTPLTAPPNMAAVVTHGRCQAAAPGCEHFSEKDGGKMKYGKKEGVIMCDHVGKRTQYGVRKPLEPGRRRRT